MLSEKECVPAPAPADAGYISKKHTFLIHTLFSFKECVPADAGLLNEKSVCC